MKRSLLILIFAMLTLSLYGQGYDIEEQIRRQQESKSTMISKSRSFLIDKLKDNDVEAIRETRRYLMDELEDEDYVALFPIEDWLIMYWTQEYKELLESYVAYDEEELLIKNSNRIEPSKDVLQIKLRDIALDFSEVIEKNISEDQELSAEERECLLLGFDDILAYYKKDIFLVYENNDRADAFLEEYPDSQYAEFIRKYVRYKLVPKKWGYGYDLFAGSTLFTGALHQRYTHGAVFGFGLDLAYRQLNLSARVSFGYPKTRVDMDYSLGTIPKGRKLISLFPEVSLGYAVYENNQIKLTPFMGVGGVVVEVLDTKQVPEFKEINEGYYTSLTAGLTFDVKLGNKVPAGYPRASYVPLRIRYTYAYPGFDKRYVGAKSGMHTITLGIGVFSRGVERKL